MQEDERGIPRHRYEDVHLYTNGAANRFIFSAFTDQSLCTGKTEVDLTAVWPPQ